MGTGDARRGKRKTQISEKNRIKNWNRENRQLKKELARKEKALAEMAALLILKKKADEIWGDKEVD